MEIDGDIEMRMNVHIIKVLTGPHGVVVRSGLGLNECKKCRVQFWLNDEIVNGISPELSLASHRWLYYSKMIDFNKCEISDEEWKMQEILK